MMRDACKEIIDRFELVRQIEELVINFPDPPKWNHIDGYDKPKAKQKFEHSIQPPKGKEPTDEFIEQELDRMINGYWFYNNGILEYITGLHYFFLNYWKDKKGRLMRFIDSQREFFLLWDAVEKDPNLAGLVLVGNRRFGKTQCGTCILYYRAIFNKGHWSGLQSKKDPDARGVFNKIIFSWRKLPDWLRPMDSGETRPAKELEFTEPRKRGAGSKKTIFDEVLESRIDFRGSDEGAYDGEELDSYLMDEAGKTVLKNVFETWKTVKKCLMRANQIKGKALITTTVEEMEKKGGANFKLIWDDATLKKVNPSVGRNTSLLTRFFVSSDWGYDGVHPVTGEKFVDDYGYSNRVAAREYILSVWSTLDGDDLASEQRKDALEIRHAFQLKNFGGCFANDLLQVQLDYLERTNTAESENAPLNLVTRVTFYRDSSGVKWRHDSNGDAYMVWDFPAPHLSNKNRKEGDKVVAPENDDSFAIGVDPIGATLTTGTEKSQAVAYVYRKGDANDPENSGLLCLRYAPKRGSIRLKADFHKYVMMLCEYYGCKANYESDIDDYYEKFLEEGFRNYVMWRPKNTIDPKRKNVVYKYGTPSKDPFAFQRQIDIGDEYIKMRYHKIYFVELVRQLIAFDRDDRTKSDEAIAFFMAIIAGMEKKMDNKPQKSKLCILPTQSRGGVSLAFKKAI